MRLGRIPYINCFPVYGAVDRGIVPIDATLVDGVPTALNRMMAEGALDEVRAILPIWNPSALWARAIGAPELVAHLMGAMSLADATSAAKLASRRYAKRQRTWLRSRMAAWRQVAPA